jgi:hypothetical protein
MAKKEKFHFKSLLLLADTPTQDGRVYTRELCDKIVARLNERPYIVIQELNLVERKLKDVRPDVVWKQKVMASIKSAQMIGNQLIFEAECRLSRDGKKLSGMVQSLGLEELEFVPVGYGIPDDKGVIGVDYELIYIAVEPIAK